MKLPLKLYAWYIEAAAAWDQQRKPAVLIYAQLCAQLFGVLLKIGVRPDGTATTGADTRLCAHWIRV